MTFQSKLLGYGHKPVAAEFPSKKYNDVVKGKDSMQAQNWNHL